MKRFIIINVVFAIMTIAATAQSSRRENSTRSERSTESRSRTATVKTTTKKTDSNSQRKERSTDVKPSNQKSNSGTSTRTSASTTRESRQPVQRTTTTTTTRPSRQPEQRSTTTSPSRQPQQRTTTTTTTRPSRQPVQTSNRPVRQVERTKTTTTTTARKPSTQNTRVYHSDRRYSTPRTHVRQVSHTHTSRPTTHHRNHTYIVREPARVNIVWDAHMHREYCEIYPYVRDWRITRGTPIYSVSAYHAIDYVGEVKRVYGYVREVYYDQVTDEYHLYFGDYFPYQDFTAIVPGEIARRMSRRPYRLFKGQYMWVTGFITEYDARPEVIVRRGTQVSLY